MLDLRRRSFITLLGGAAVTWPLVAHAQQATSSVSVLKVEAMVMSSSSAAFFAENFAGTVSVFTGAPGTDKMARKDVSGSIQTGVFFGG